MLLTLLPEPDSPTIPSVRPRSRTNENSVHGPDQAVVGLEVDPQVADLQQRRHQNRTLGSTTAYKMSTIMLAMTMKKEAIMTTPMISGRSWFWMARMVN